MLELILFLLGLVGSGVASYFDLKTTEVPDEIPYAMVAVALIIFLLAYANGEKSFLINGLLYGIFFLAIGLGLYYFGQWGGADAKLLAVFGFLYGNFKGRFLPFCLEFFVNLFLVGAVYIIVYSLAVSIKNRTVWKKFKDSLKDSKHYLGSLIVIMLATVVAYLVGFVGLKMFYLAISVEVILFAMYLVLSFLMIAERVVFRKKVPVSELKVGDVLLNSKLWEGVDEKTVKKIRKSGKKYVWIKEGVRFVPTFTIALIVTELYGSLLSFFLL